MSFYRISPGTFLKMREEGAFSFDWIYLRLAGEDEIILGYCADDYYWRDMGRPGQLKKAQQEVGE